MRLNLSLVTLAALACVIPGNAQNVTPDGVILIDQQHALVGGIGDGDASGFPITITHPGSYRLASNLVVPNANTSAIVVAADNVKIDLNGFSILGPTVCFGEPVTSCSPVGTGIGVSADVSHRTSALTVPAYITVVNGSVRGMGSFGIVLQGGGDLVEKVHATSNGATGIFVHRGIARDNIAESNGSAGIVFDFGTVTGNEASFNFNYGMLVSCPSSLANNTVVANGIPGIGTSGAGCALANNAVQ